MLAEGYEANQMYANALPLYRRIVDFVKTNREISVHDDEEITVTCNLRLCCKRARLYHLATAWYAWIYE